MQPSELSEGVVADSAKSRLHRHESPSFGVRSVSPTTARDRVADGERSMTTNGIEVACMDWENGDVAKESTQTRTVQRLQEGLKRGKDTVDKIRKLMQRFNQRLTLNNPRLAERYNKGELQILIQFRRRMSDIDYVAVFQKPQCLPIKDPEGPIHHVVHDLAKSLAADTLIHKLRLEPSSHFIIEMDHASGRANSHNQSMLVDVIKLVEYPELVSLPAFVWFDRVDRVDRVLPRALYFSSTLGLVYRGILGDREVNAARSGGASGSGSDEVASQMIKGTSEVLDGIPGDARDAIRDRSDSRYIIEEISRFRIMLFPDFVWVGVEEGSNITVDIVDVLFGPFEF
jgi:hypothetical protein